MQKLAAAFLVLFFGFQPPAYSLQPDHHVLWSVQGKHNTVYLLGSVHFLSADEQLPAAMDEAYRAAKSLMMEIDLDDLDPLQMQQTTLQLGLVDENDSLEKQVGAEAFAKVSARARELDMDPSLLNRFKPWLAALTLTQLTLMKHGLDPNSGVEQRFVARAAQDGKEIRGLETIQQQLGMLAGLPPKQQREFLLYSVEDSEHATQEIDALISAWRKGDTPSLAALLQDGFDEFPHLYRPLTVERNQAWMNRLESLLKDEDDCLVIVGALHLVGKDSVVDLLERKGYVVKQK